MTAVDTQPRPPVVGEAAPDFTLASTAGDEVTLSSFRGERNVLVAFFPLAFTSVCTAEMCAFSDDYDAIAATGTVVLPVSVDSVPTLKEFRAKHGMRVQLLSDFKREASRRYTCCARTRSSPGAPTSSSTARGSSAGRTSRRRRVSAGRIARSSSASPRSVDAARPSGDPGTPRIVMRG